MVAVGDGVHGAFGESQINGGVVNGKRRNMRNSCLYFISRAAVVMR